MLTLTILGDEYYDESAGEFITKGDVTLELEHSLHAISKWELKYEKPFLAENEKTKEEMFNYISCMIVTPDFPPEVLYRLTKSNLDEINEYLQAKHTATWFSETQPTKKNTQVITSELIYYWMIARSIPMECQYWNLSRLLVLIRVYDINNDPDKKKMSRQEILARNRKLNAERKAKYGTSG